MLSLARVAGSRALAVAAAEMAPVLARTAGPALAVAPKRHLKGAVAMDGNTAAAYVAYALSEMHTIFPITPATTMGECADEWNTKKKKNIWGQVPTVTEMQSEAGVSGSVHGAAMSGALVSTFTTSQGLLLMIPNMFRLTGGMYPAVFHVASRSVAGQSLSIHCDHADVMAVRPSGINMLVSNTAQEVMDIGAAAHLAAIQLQLPFVHFFDGFKTSHEINTVLPLSYEFLKSVYPQEALEAYRASALTPERPDTRGVIQDNLYMWQIIEAAQPRLNRVGEVVQKAFDDIGKATGRHYKLFDYEGHPEADRVIVVMGSGDHAVSEIVRKMNAEGQKVGMIKVRLYRPFIREAFLQALPASCKKVAVLDRVREAAAAGDPLFLDVSASIPRERDIKVVGGRFGIGGYEFTPAMAGAVFEHLKADAPADRFLVGIKDDILNRSIPIGEEVDATPEGTRQCMFWGMGADGTVSANKEAISIISEDTDLYGQGNFVYTAHKSGGITVSHLRFGKHPQLSSYCITKADFIACHVPGYLRKFTQLLAPIKQGGTFLLNSSWNSLEELDKNLPNYVKRQIAQKKLEFYQIDASKLGQELGLSGHINMIMQAAFFKLLKLMPDDEAIALLKKAVAKKFGRKGAEIVKKNNQAMDKAVEYMKKVEYPASWADCPDDTEEYLKTPESWPSYIRDIMVPIQRLQGDKLTVKSFTSGNLAQGIMPAGATEYEKRGFSAQNATWAEVDNCTQCNLCSVLCPHAAIRPFLFTPAEGANLPKDFVSVKAKRTGKMPKDMRFSIQVSPYDCTGCGVCAQQCPDHVIKMVPAGPERVRNNEHFLAALGLPNHDEFFAKDSLKGSQFVKPLLEFSGACAGCTQTPVMKLVTQLFGEQMFLGNMAGCSCVWCSYYPMSSFTKSKRGFGPAYGQGLFEDGAEFGLGMYLATDARRQRIKTYIKDVVKQSPAELTPKLKDLFTKLLKVYDDRAQSFEIAQQIKQELPEAPENHFLAAIAKEKQLLSKKSHWVMGGDGWAYDIGYGGLDHVLAQGKDIKVMVLDNEVYANTGGQASKATPRSSIAKFAMGGKVTPKKDLGSIFMTYGNIYVASISLQADPNQAIRAIKEAEAYNGPAILIHYTPCINHGIVGGLTNSVVEAKRAVEEGYHVLYRFNPDLAKKGKNPFQLDSHPKKGVEGVIKAEVRYNSLAIVHNKQEADRQHKNMTADMKARFARYESYGKKN